VICVRKEKFYAVAFIVIMALMAASYLHEYTGFFALEDVIISVIEVYNGKIIVQHNNTLAVGSFLNISVEFKNTGSIDYSATITENIYKYVDGELNLSAQYQDSTVYMVPGTRRNFKTVYKPASYGIYYIRFRVNYASRTSEVWGVFTVNDPSAQQNTTQQNGTQTTTQPVTQTPSSGSQTTTQAPASSTNIIKQVSRLPAADISYPTEVNISVNQTHLISIIIKNVGETSLKNIKLFVSSPDIFEIKTNPKVIPWINKDESSIFIISINTSRLVPGKYSIDFEIISDEMRLKKSIIVNIMPEEISPKEGIGQSITSYSYLILQIDQEISIAEVRNFDVSEAKESIENAKASLDKAASYYEKEEYELARAELENTGSHIENSAFRLANSMLEVYATPLPVIYLVFIAPAAALPSYILMRRWKKRDKMKRPKFLKSSESED